MLNMLTTSQAVSLLSSSELSQHEPPGLVLGDLARPDDLQHHLLAVVADEDQLAGGGAGGVAGGQQGRGAHPGAAPPAHTLPAHLALPGAAEQSELGLQTLETYLGLQKVFFHWAFFRERLDICLYVCPSVKIVPTFRYRYQQHRSPT